MFRLVVDALLEAFVIVRPRENEWRIPTDEEAKLIDTAISMAIERAEGIEAEDDAARGAVEATRQFLFQRAAAGPDQLRQLMKMSAEDFYDLALKFAMAENDRVREEIKRHGH